MTDQQREWLDLILEYRQIDNLPAVGRKGAPLPASRAQMDPVTRGRLDRLDAITKRILELQAQRVAITSKLSDAQRVLLKRLYWQHQAGKVESDIDGALGVPYRTHSTDGCEAASTARTLARLEQRGLILRQSRSGSPRTGLPREHQGELHGRTTHVMLLPAGGEVAKRLTADHARKLTVSGVGRGRELQGA